ncbi:MAG: eukaryotic translation initiation factor 3 subunit J, partial [Olpidium bornovanus]
EEWDASSDEEEKPKEPVAPALKKKKSVAQAAAERQAAEEKKKKELDEKRKAAAAARADEDPQARKERLRQLELEADMANATDLFSGVSTDDKVEEAGDPEKVALEKMAPKTKEQFDQFQKALVDAIGKHKVRWKSLVPVIRRFVRPAALPRAEG